MTVQEYRKQLPPFYQLGDKELRDFAEIKVKEALELAAEQAVLTIESWMSQQGDSFAEIDKKSITDGINLIKW